MVKIHKCKSRKYAANVKAIGGDLLHLAIIPRVKFISQNRLEFNLC